MAAEEMHHEILCAVIQAELLDRQAFTWVTLHNARLRIIDLGGVQRLVPQQRVDVLDGLALHVQVGGEGVPPIPHAE
jgi:hypothetical protein